MGFAVYRGLTSEGGKGRPETIWETISVENLLLSEKIQIERKQFFFDLKENPRGRFLRITEDVGGRRDTIIIPSTGLEQFIETIARAVRANQDSETIATEN